MSWLLYGPKFAITTLKKNAVTTRFARRNLSRRDSVVRAALDLYRKKGEKDTPVYL